jgi:hypothetical protein
MAGDPFAQRIFASCGVKQRHLTLLEDHADQTLQRRTAASEDQLFDLSVHAVDRLVSTRRRSTRWSGRVCTRSAVRRLHTDWWSTTR